MKAKLIVSRLLHCFKVFNLRFKLFILHFFHVPNSFSADHSAINNTKKSRKEQNPSGEMMKTVSCRVGELCKSIKWELTYYGV